MRQVESWLASVLLSDKKLWQIDGWFWRSGKEVTRGWRLPNKDWTRLWWLDDPQYTDISVHWNITADGDEWKQRWLRLWKGKALPRHKVWLWRLLQQGLPTLERASKWGFSDGRCAWCNLDTESVEHVVWECSRLHSRTQWLTEVLMGSEFSTPTFIQTAHSVLLDHHHRRLIIRDMLNIEGMQEGIGDPEGVLRIRQRRRQHFDGSSSESGLVGVRLRSL
ncbi:hypothetical protein R1sor_009569 [Riccia sorocarpa]|uniref:Reverse transcriptase zinc-binding domain-containing protein n=1 Tax=Riccia sorocarpa TaxID=122646 RepID=A0ABD3HVG3_9MARC